MFQLDSEPESINARADLPNPVRDPAPGALLGA